MPSLVNYTSYGQLGLDVRDFTPSLPQDLVGVVGIPRSGMLPACMISEIRHLPLGNLTEFARSGQFMAGGNRLESTKLEYPVEGKVLVIDDSIYMGTEMQKSFKLWFDNQDKLSKFTPIWAAVYKNPYFHDPGILTHIETHDRRYFEWNLMHHPALVNTMCDIDGILCPDPPVDDDGVQYQKYINSAVALYCPSVRMLAFVSMRLEKWRPETEGWLTRHNIAYDELILCPEATVADRRAIGGYGIFKGRHYRHSKASLFIESCPLQAAEIAKVSEKPVICLTNGKVYQT